MLDAQLKAAQLRLTELQKESAGRGTRLDEVLRRRRAAPSAALELTAEAAYR